MDTVEETTNKLVEALKLDGLEFARWVAETLHEVAAHRTTKVRTMKLLEQYREKNQWYEKQQVKLQKRIRELEARLEGCEDDGPTE